MASRSRLFSKIAKDVGSDGNLTAAALSSDVSFGATVYDSTGVLPYVGNDTGDQAYVKSTNRFYIWDSAGWYNVALINRAPTILSVLDSDGASSPFVLSADGIATTITITATDSDGDPITYTATTDANFNGLATVTGSANEFTITPFSRDSATTNSGIITFKATDGINISSSISTFTLNFISDYWDETVLSIGTSSTNGLDNDTFIDRSTYTHTVTSSNTPVQTAFHPYLNNWSVDFDGNDYLTFADQLDWDFVNSGDFTVDSWIYPRSTSNISWFGQSGGGGSRSDKWGIYINDTSVGLSAGTIGWHLGSNGNIQGPSFTPTANTWYHIRLGREGDVWYFFVDGVLLGTTTSAIRPTPVAQTLRVGADGEAYRIFNGYLSNFRIVKGTNLSTTTFAPITENLTAVTNTVLLTCQSNRVVDNSTNNYSATYVGDPAVSALNPFGQRSEYAVGENKGSTLFNKTNYLTYPQDNAWIFGTDDVTIEAWVYPIGTQGDAYTSTGMIYGKATGAGAYWFSEVFRVSETHLYFSTNNVNGNSNGVTISAANVITTNQWQHVVFTQYTIESIRYWSLYCNGDRVYHSSTTNNLNVSSAGWTHHTGYYPGNAISYDYNGYISDLKISKSALYTSSSYTIPTSPLENTSAYLYMPMDNAGVFDKTGNHVLTLGGNTSASTTQTKFADTAMYFDGTGDFARITNMPSFSTNDFTVEGWINVANNSSNHNIADARNGSTNSWVIQLTSYELKIYDEISATYIHSTSGNWMTSNLNTWVHIAWCRSGSTSRFFINGTQEGSDVSNSSNYQNTSLRIGSRFSEDQQYLQGYIENFQILNGVAKYTTNFTPPTETQGRTYQTTS